MEITEIISHHIDKTQNVIFVEFKILGDFEDVVRQDMIEYNIYEEFGFSDEEINIDEILNEDDYDEWDNDEYDYIADEDKLISFLNEYYIVYPKKLPKPEFK